MADIAEQGFPVATDVAAAAPPGGQVTAQQQQAVGEQTRVKVGAGI